MARLGSVVGAILADVMRARLAADELSRELAEEYRRDPVLASMSVPRVVVDEAALTLRFSVSEVALEDPPPPDPRELRTAWLDHVGTTLVRRAIEPLGSAPERRAVAARALGRNAAGKPSLAVLRQAIAGDSAGLAAVTVEPLLDSWGDLGPDVRSALGGKAAFRRRLERDVGREFGSFLERQRELRLVREALMSRTEVAVRSDELPTEPELIQELRITARGEDMDVLVRDLETVAGEEEDEER